MYIKTLLFNSLQTGRSVMVCGMDIRIISLTVESGIIDPLNWCFRGWMGNREVFGYLNCKTSSGWWAAASEPKTIHPIGKEFPATSQIPQPGQHTTDY